MIIEKILVIHGPNLNLLGTREPDIYGEESEEQLFQFIKNSFPDTEFIFFQSNHEGFMIDEIHDKKNWADAMIINAGALSHYSYAIRDAIKAVSIPTVEVHISDVNNRQEFRKKLVLSDVCVETISGKRKR